MVLSTILLQAGLLGLVASASASTSTSTSIKKRWTNGSSATGPTDPNVVDACTYWANDIAAHDTCAALESYFGITAEQLASWNPSLASADCALTVGYSYCVEGPYVPPSSSTSSTMTTVTTTTTSTSTTTTTTTTSDGPSPTQTGLEPSCSAFYLVETGDTCFDIAAAHGVELQQFYDWNPAVGNTCSGLQAGYYVCVGVPGQSSTRTTSTITTTTAPEPTATGPSPQQPGIIDTCNKFYRVASGDTCVAIAGDNGIPLDSFYAWNPAIGSDCSALWGGYYVCVGVPGRPTTTTTTTTTTTGLGLSPTQSGIIGTCTEYYQARSGDSCSSIVSGRYSYVPLSTFISWNPAVGSSCTGLWAGYYYCVATESWAPQPGTVTNCRRYHRVVGGNTCQGIQQRYGITAAQFNRWNPNVGQNCASLWAGYFVCVGI